MRGVPAIPQPSQSPVSRPNRKRAPYRPFFLIASLDAIAAVGAWLLVPFEQLPIPDVAVWHRNALLFGTIPAMLAGFLLTALPRWTGRPTISSSTLGALVGLWMSGRAASLVSGFAGLGVASAFLASVTALAARDILRARDYRNCGIVLLLSGLCVGAILTAVGWHLELALRMSLASIVSLMAVVGGRVVPAVTLAYLQGKGVAVAVRRSMLVEHSASLSMATSLSAWAIYPETRFTGMLCVAACAGQLMRMLQWHGCRSTGNWSILALHAGYCWIPVGFGLLSVHALLPDMLRESAAIHAWMIGAFGTLGIAIMSSMIRKHVGRPFSRASPAAAACASISLSCLSRLMLETPAAHCVPWGMLSASLWVLSFGLFLATFARDLIPGRSGAWQPEVFRS